MVNLVVWGPVVWIFWIPENERECYLGVSRFESQTTGPQTTLPLVDEKPNQEDNPWFFSQVKSLKSTPPKTNTSPENLFEMVPFLGDMLIFGV